MRRLKVIFTSRQRLAILLFFTLAATALRFAMSMRRMMRVKLEADEVRSLVPFNGFFPKSQTLAVNDILENELKSLLEQLKTKQITTVYRCWVC